MKQYLTTTLALACAVLVISLVFIKRGDSAQHETDAGAIADFSNRLDSAQVQIASCNGTILTLSNRLDESQSAALTFSNQLVQVQSTLNLTANQVGQLSRQAASVESENQTLNQRILDLTNQVAGLTSQITLTQSNLNQANNDYVLLENRLRQDVAERLVVERKFNNPSELQAQMKYLKKHPNEVISADSIYAGLGVEVKSNTVHVIAPK
jgi:chromosome segregation ATPase